jgi:hypothetical protein
MILFLSSCGVQDKSGIIIDEDNGIKTIHYTTRAKPLYKSVLLGDPVVFGSNQSAETYLLAEAAYVGEDSNGNILINDEKSGRIHIFDASGTWQHSFGSTGQGPQEFGLTYEPYLANGELLVWNIYNLRLLRFSTAGEFLSVWTSKVPIGTEPVPMGNDNRGPFTTFHLNTHHSQNALSDMQSEMTLLQVDLLSTAMDTLFYNSRDNRVAMLAGAIAYHPFTVLYLPHAVSPRLPLAIGEVHAFVIRLIPLQGGQRLFIELSKNAEPLPDDIREDEIVRFRRYGLEEAARRNLEFPNNYPFIRWMLWDSIGRLWVENYEKSQMYEMGRHYEIFNKEGDWLFSQDLPGRLAGANKLGCYINDFGDSGEPVVRFYACTWR